MRVTALRIRNLCAAREVTIRCDNLTVFVGRNGAGKSTLLRALDLFYDTSPELGPTDFYAEDTSNPIEIGVTFSDLTVEARAQFAGYLDGGTLSVVRVFTWAGSRIVAKYHGETLQHAPFQSVRSITGARELVAAYKVMRQQEHYGELPDARSKELALDGLRSWEALHPDECLRMRDDGQFFGFSEVAQGYLGRHTRLIRIPAVRDASDDANEGRGSPITQLMDLVVRRTLASRDELTALKTEIQEKYRAIIDPAQAAEVAGLAGSLSSTLQTYVPEADVVLTWGQSTDIELPMPKAVVRVREDGHLSPVERTGHGMQRALILTLLQHLVCTVGSTNETPASDPDNSAVPASPNLILLIEEPELYQHPNRQRHFATTLLKLAAGAIPGVATQTQVLYCTHSPLFVGLDRFDQVRLVRKVAVASGGPKACTVASASLSEVAQELWKAGGTKGVPYDAETLRPRLAAIMTPWVNEGFFADVVVLVEGEGDRAAILTVAKEMGKDFEADGIAVIPCMGKRNLDRPALIFRGLELPVYLVWDADKGRQDSKPATNRALVHIMGGEDEDYPSGVTERYAVFPIDLESTLREELGYERCARLTNQTAEQLGLSGESRRKNPLAVRELIERAYAEGAASPTIEQIVICIAAARAGSELSAADIAAT